MTRRFEQQYIGTFISPKTVLVVAGNKREFDDFCRLHRAPGDEFIYVSSSRKLLGARDADVVFYGTYFNRVDFTAIVEAYKRQGGKGLIDTAISIRGVEPKEWRKK